MQVSEDIKRQVQNFLSQAKADYVHRLAVGAVVTKGSAILLLTRSDEDMLPRHLEIPGGGVDEGEDIFSALKRELFEETALTCTAILSCLEPFDFWVGKQKVRQLNFVVKTEQSEIALNPKEHESYSWHDSNESLDGKIITPEMRKLVESSFLL
ncbi:MAG TPA: NUDIX hydrolase [Candidatus Peribacteraceae bacterium]|nr:NUDIX hydrolase [Candidatus Peribacteraceae bacterium]